MFPFAIRPPFMARHQAVSVTGAWVSYRQIPNHFKDGQQPGCHGFRVSLSRFGCNHPIPITTAAARAAIQEPAPSHLAELCNNHFSGDGPKSRYNCICRRARAFRHANQFDNDVDFLLFDLRGFHRLQGIPKLERRQGGYSQNAHSSKAPTSNPPPIQTDVLMPCVGSPKRLASVPSNGDATEPPENPLERG